VRSHIYGCGILPDDAREKAKEAAVEQNRRALWRALKATRTST
jgi:hypothetical protein